jgi:adenylyltransferase/sulfurtransferase
MLSNEEIRRYSRHLILPEVALQGQERLKAAKVLVVGAGGLGSSTALYLAAAGVGRLGLADFDVVDLSNLQRQVLHGTSRVGKPKLESARERLSDLNPEVELRLHPEAFRRDNALDILADYDFVLDGSDNFATRYLVNDAAAFAGKADIYGSVYRFEGQVTVFDPAQGGPCYRCLHPEPPPPDLVPSCAEGGVLGVLPGTIGLLQATEALKRILGIGESLAGRLLRYDALTARFRETRISRDPACPLCGSAPTISALQDYESFCGTGGAALEDGEAPDALSVRTLKAWMDAGRRFTLVDVRPPHEWALAAIPGALRIPLERIPERVHALDSAEEMVLFCHRSSRSVRAQAVLAGFGFRKTYHLSGGIDSWAALIDPTLPRY